MAFSLGFNMRGTAGYVTDDAHFGVPCLGEAYPHTYTNGDGQSINAGWDAGINPLDRLNTNDPRIAGINYANGTKQTFTVDLSSGSNPGTGSYVVDIAMGDPANTQFADFIVQDNTTTLITTGGRIATNTNHFIDATITDVLGGATWNGTTVTVTFSTTTCHVIINNPAFGVIFPLSHFRLTFQPSAAAVSQHLLMLMGVGA